MLCLLLPEDSAEILPTFRALTCFDRLQVTTEDRTRSEMMQAERQRQSLGLSQSKEEFLRSLELQVRFFRAEPTDLDRITQLINKTNQFNLTTRRRTLDQVRELSRSPHHRLFGVEVSDRFGAYGLTGVVIVEAPGVGAPWMVDTLLLSCRVLGRDVETALLAALALEASTEGVSEIAASFIPSPKNAPAANFLPDHGFVADSTGVWRISTTQVPPVHPSITLFRNR